ncbi:MAG: alpha/beta hydrolase [Microthrixaceae bacterium]
MAYDLSGDGPLVILVPGMGDLRSTYRFLAPTLVAGGFRVASMDLRGHGDSDTTFASYGDDETAGDISALIEDLAVPAVVVGNSMGAASAALVAADRPELVNGLVLIGPFLRNGATSRLQQIGFRLAMTPLWAAAVWKAYLPKLYAGQRPTDFESHRSDMVASLRRPGYAKAFSLTTHTNHDVAEACLGRVSTPVLVVMGEADPDFPDPTSEAAWIEQELDAQVVMVPEAGHYPQSQRPDITTPAVIEFLEALPQHG